MRRKKRNHLPGCKAKVALAGINGDKTLAELSEQFDAPVFRKHFDLSVTKWYLQSCEQLQI